jgi:hypothetical protein
MPVKFQDRPRTQAVSAPPDTACVRTPPHNTLILLAKNFFLFYDLRAGAFRHFCRPGSPRGTRAASRPAGWRSERPDLPCGPTGATGTTRERVREAPGSGRGCGGNQSFACVRSARRKIAMRFAHHWLADRPARRGRCPLRPPLWGSFNRCAVSVAAPADGRGLHPSARKTAGLGSRPLNPHTDGQKALADASKGIGGRKIRGSGQKPPTAFLRGLRQGFW